MTAFAYVDDSIRAFMMALQQQPERYAKTLFVITADHTSGTIAGDQRERMRIPLIFYSPALREQMIEWRQCQMRLAGQVDILPTILYLLGGGRLFAGMGRCLVAETRADPGCISSSRSESFYLTESGMLGYDPYEDEATLALADGTDPSPEQVARARADFLALYEVSRRLVWEHRIVPATIRELPTRDLTSSAGAGGR